MNEAMITVLKNSANPESKRTDSDIYYQLTSPLQFQPNSYEVALLQLTYKPKQSASNTVQPSSTDPTARWVPRKRRRKLQLHERPVLPDPVFPGYRPAVKRKIIVQKRDKNITDFINRFNTDIGNLNDMELSIKLAGSTDKGVTWLKVVNSDLSRVYYLSRDLANMLKQRRVQCRAGTFVGGDVLTQSDFNKFGLSSDLSILVVDYKYSNSIITITEPKQSLFAFNKPAGEMYQNFLNNIATDLLKLDFIVNFSFDADKKCTVDVKGNNLQSAYDHLVISSNLLSCMGFSQDRFQLGVHRATVAFDETKFNLITTTDTVFVRLTFTDVENIFMAEPKSNHVIDVLTELNTSIALQKYSTTNIGFYYADGYIVLNEDIPENVTVKLPDLLCKYFGIPLQSSFTPGSKFPTEKEVIEEEEQLEYVHKGESWIKPSTSHQKLLITSNVVKAQLYGDNVIGLLREVVMSSDYNNVTRIDFNPVWYLPVCCEGVSVLQVNFMDENLLPVQLDGETSVTLGFRSHY